MADSIYVQVVTALIKPATVQNAALQLAITVARKAIPAISHAIVTTLAEAPRAAWVADTLAAEEVVKNAINAGKWVTSPATVLKAVREAMEEEAVAMVVEAMEVGTEADALSKLAIPVAATDTCLVTAPKARSVTTAVRLAI
ncbi:MAG: hypothetical protein Q9197_002348 [Variospora fuerteventurae]